MSKSVGFIMLRHVNNKAVDNYWKICYKSIRYNYPHNYIIIIDDDSNYSFVDKEYEKTLTNTKIINSEYPKCAEVLPYYYYLSNKLFDIAVILHDSVFLNCKVKFNSIKNYMLLWEIPFGCGWQRQDEIRLIKTLDNSKELLDFHAKPLMWNGCFGGMSIISHNYLSYLNKKYNISKLLPAIRTRYNRMSFERVIGCILQLNDKKRCLLGPITTYGTQHITINNINKVRHLPFIKIWSGR